MNFPLIFTWSYDPFGIIFELRSKQKTILFVHTQRSEIEKYMNYAEWEENTLQEAEEKLVSMITSQTITPHKQSEKISRNEDSPSVTDVSTNDFQIYRKKTKTIPTTCFLKDGEMQSTIVLEGPHSLAQSTSLFT